jgi:hypothetical protein
MTPVFRRSDTKSHPHFFAERHLLGGCFLLLPLCVSLTSYADGISAASQPANGSAADLAGLPSVGWPLGVPLTCKAMTDSLAQTLREATYQLRDYCNEQNEKMRSAGYKTCGINECLDSAVTRDNGYDHGKFVLRIYRSVYTGEPVLTLTYSYPSNVAPNGTFPVCFDPVTRAESLLTDEFAMWDFKRFAEFCAQTPQEQPNR